MMRRHPRSSVEELTRLLAGETATGDEASKEVAAMLIEARYALSTVPDAATRALHLAAISEESQLVAGATQPGTAQIDNGRRPMGARLETWRRVVSLTKSLLLKGSAAALAASMSMIGLAYAGADLPDQAAQALETVTGLELPNQAGGGSEDLTADDVTLDAQGPDEVAADVAQEIWDYVSTTEDTGCVFGQNVAAIASGGDNLPDEACTDAGSEGNTTGADAAEEGKANRPADAGADAAEEGQANNPTGAGADDAGDGAAEEGQANNPTGAGADDADDAGDDAAEEGQANNPTGRP